MKWYVHFSTSFRVLHLFFKKSLPLEGGSRLVEEEKLCYNKKQMRGQARKSRLFFLRESLGIGGIWDYGQHHWL